MEAAPIKVEIVGEQGSYQLLRGGAPYQVKGAGTQMPEDYYSLAARGGNSVRTWSTDNAQEVLDRALELDLTVTLCLDVKRERHGFDYNDEAAVQAQFDKMKGEVEKFKDHPALLAWMIGNELNFAYENPKVFDAVNDMAEMIQEIDPNHPVTTATAGWDDNLAQVLKERAPALDFISVQVYGALLNLPNFVDFEAYGKPFMVTEWGTIGHWEVGLTAWEAPLELISHDKAQRYYDGYTQIIEPLAGTLIGDYVFLWGDKQERTPTWYGMFAPGGGATETVDVMQKLWTGSWPESRAPIVTEMKLSGLTAADSVKLKTGEVFVAQVTVEATSNYQFEWRVMRESTSTKVGGDEEYIPEDLSANVRFSGGDHAEILAPEPGAYRLFVYVRNGDGAVGYGNTPFYVE
jgi:hypothetical protein